MFGLTNPSARRKDAYGGDTAHGSAPAAKHRRDVPVDSPSPSDIDAIAATAGITYTDHRGDLDAFIAAGSPARGVDQAFLDEVDRIFAGGVGAPATPETLAELDKVTSWAKERINRWTEEEIAPLGSDAVAKVVPFPKDAS